ncbi:MAG: hypothetical protein PHI99_11320 [Syntrophales bacterium]|nr:hypothetical protein [Syntrophales bacterium]
MGKSTAIMIGALLLFAFPFATGAWDVAYSGPSRHPIPFESAT